jgi:hypothetical protein
MTTIKDVRELFSAVNEENDSRHVHLSTEMKDNELSPVTAWEDGQTATLTVSRFHTPFQNDPGDLPEWLHTIAEETHGIYCFPESKPIPAL